MASLQTAETGAVLKRAPLQCLYERQFKGLITYRSWSEELSFTHSLQKAIEKARLQTGAVLKHFPLQILYEKARLQTGAVWSCSEVPSLKNPL